jgi:plastocyanin
MRIVGILASLGLLLASFAVPTPVAAGDPCYHGFELPARSESDEPQVKMMACAFAPTVVRVAPGTTVQWFNGLETHLLTGANQEWGFRDDEIGPRETVAFRFDRPGTYPYACALHRGMVGTIVVGDGVAVAGSGPAIVQMKTGATAVPDASGSALTAGAAPAVTVVPPPNAALAVTAAPSPAAASSPVTATAALAIAITAGGLATLGLLLLSRRAGSARPQLTSKSDRLPRP